MSKSKQHQIAIVERKQLIRRSYCADCQWLAECRRQYKVRLNTRACNEYTGQDEKWEDVKEFLRGMKNDSKTNNKD